MLYTVSSHIVQSEYLMLRLFPCPTNSLDQVFLCDSLATCEVPSSNLGINLDARIWWDEMVWNVVALENRNPRLDNGVVFPGQASVSLKGQRNQKGLELTYHSWISCCQSSLFRASVERRA